VEYGKADWRTFDRGIEKEWLLTNGIGGFASSTIIGANTRRYHGLLVASLHPPVERHLIVSKIDESLHIGENTYNLYSFKTFDYIMKGYKYLQRVEIDHIPTFYYNVEDVFVEKKICMAYGENTTGVMYRIVNGENATTLKLAPLINFRNYHHNSYKSNMNFKSQKTKDGVSITPYNLDVNIKINCNQGSFIRTEDNWFINMEYPVEKERGLPSTEDHYIPGYFEINIKPGEIEEISLIATWDRKPGTVM
jgi:predicted glycogen debranching enzyme